MYVYNCVGRAGLDDPLARGRAARLGGGVRSAAARASRGGGRARPRRLEPPRLGRRELTPRGRQVTRLALRNNLLIPSIQVGSLSPFYPTTKKLCFLSDSKRSMQLYFYVCYLRTVF